MRLELCAHGCGSVNGISQRARDHERHQDTDSHLHTELEKMAAAVEFNHGGGFWLGGVARTAGLLQLLLDLELGNGSRR